MTRASLLHRCIFAALLLLIAATSFGLWIASSNKHTSRLESREDYTHVFAQLAAHPGQVPAELDPRLHEIWTANRAIDTHTHAANMALVVVLFALLSALLEPARRWPLAGLAIGAVIYPAGLVVQYFNAEFIGQLIAAAGATMIIVCGVVMTVGFIRALRQS